MFQSQKEANISSIWISDKASKRKKFNMPVELSCNYWCEHSKQNMRKLNLKPKKTYYDQVYINQGIQGLVQH